MPGPIDVVVADDHPIVREGVVRLLTRPEDIRVVGEAADGHQALELIRSLRPAVALVDWAMPGLDGAEVAAAVRAGGLPTRVLVLSAHTEAPLVFSALERGASGFLSKEAGRDEIVQAVRDAAAGRDVLPASLAGGLVGEIWARGPHTGSPLSAREWEVLNHLARGVSVPAMAQQMFVAPSTVKTHVQRLYEKLGVNDRGAAVAEAMRRGLLW